MSRKTLKALFHMGAKEYKTEYESRFNAEDTILLSVNIGENAAFICQTPEIYKQIISIERMDKAVEAVAIRFLSLQYLSSLPNVL